MRDRVRTHALLAAGVSIAALVASSPAQAILPFLLTTGSTTRAVPEKPAKKVKKAPIIKSAPATTTAEKAAPPIQGQLHVIVSIDKQRATLFANGQPVASTAISTGTKSHPTPMGVFSVIQKNRHHVSNLYHAQMPFMQRLTWSGTALHQGPLPGYPASHGCIRLTTAFAETLWKATKIGARVIVTKPEVTPSEIAHPVLFGPKPKVAAVAPIKTADASNAMAAAVVQDTAKTEPAAEQTETPKANETAPAAAAATPSGPAVDERWTATEAAAGMRDIERRTSPVSVFVSRKDQKLYVRQGMEPVFEVAVKIHSPQQPIGTHVYTAMEIKDGGNGMRWNAISIPSGYPRDAVAAAPAKKIPGKKTAPEVKPQPVVDHGPAPNASAALDRLELPQDTVERITAMMSVGSSLIVSDNGISHETGKYTDFIVLEQFTD